MLYKEYNAGERLDKFSNGRKLLIDLEIFKDLEFKRESSY